MGVHVDGDVVLEQLLGRRRVPRRSGRAGLGAASGGAQPANMAPADAIRVLHIQRRRVKAWPQHCMACSMAKSSAIG